MYRRLFLFFHFVFIKIYIHISIERIEQFFVTFYTMVKQITNINTATSDKVGKNTNIQKLWELYQA